MVFNTVLSYQQNLPTYQSHAHLQGVTDNSGLSSPAVTREKRIQEYYQQQHQQAQNTEMTVS